MRSVGTVVDITHLKETEAALRESELRLRLALEAAQMGTFEADIGGSQATIDAQEAHLLGLPPKTRLVSSEELRARIPLEDLQTSDAKKERLERHNEAYHHEFRLRMPDGSERWLCAYAAIRSNRIVGVNFDVTERKRTEAALRESEARLRIATNAAALGVFERDVKADRMVWANDRAFEIFGHTRADRRIQRDSNSFRTTYIRTTPRRSRKHCGMRGGKGAATTLFAASARRAVCSGGCRSMENTS